MSVSVVPGTFAYIGFMVKDIGARLVKTAHKLRDAREMYPVLRHQNIKTYRTMIPWTQDAAFVAPSAMIMGNVVLGHDVAVFYHTIIRNLHTKDSTKIGDHTAIMDRTSFLGAVQIGHHTYIGQGVTLDCCQIHDSVYIGAGSAICLGAVVESGSIIAPGSVVYKDVRVPAGELWAGNPAEKISDVTHEQSSEVQHMVHQQIKVAKAHNHAIHDHIHQTEELSKEWLEGCIAQMEKQQSNIKVKTVVDIPIEARRFLQPRVHMRRPEMHMRVSYPVNKIAPWMLKMPDQGANA